MRTRAPQWPIWLQQALTLHCAPFAPSFRGPRAEPPYAISLRRVVTSSLQSMHGPYFGDFGGRFVPEALIAALDELEHEFRVATADPDFAAEFARLQHQYTGRPNPLTEVPRFAARPSRVA